MKLLRLPLMCMLLFGGCGGKKVELPQNSSFAKDTPHPRLLVRLDSRPMPPSLLAVSPDNAFAIGQTQVETIAYDLRKRQEIGHWPSADSQWSYSDDSKHLLRLDGDTVSVLSSETLKVLQSWKADPRLPQADEDRLQLNACISPNGRRVAVSNQDGCFLQRKAAELLILDTATGEVTLRLDFPIKRPEPPKSCAWKFDFVGSSSRLMVTQDAYVLKQSALINVDDGRVLHRFADDTEQRVASKSGVIAAAKVARRPDTFPVVESENDVISLVDLATGDELRSIEVAGTLRDFDIDPSGSQVIASVQPPDATVPPQRNDTELDTRGRLTVLRQWGVRSGKLLDELNDFDFPITQVRYGAARWNCFLDMEYPAGIDDDLDHLWRWIRLPSGERLDAESCFSQMIASDLHHQLFFSADEKRFLIQGGDVCVHELPSGKPNWCAEPREYPSEKASFSADGRFAWFDHTLTEMGNGHQRQWHDLRDVLFLADGQRIFHQGSNGVGILSLATGEFLWHRRLNWNSPLHDSAVSADGRYVALLLSDTRVFAEDRSATRLVLLDRKDENNPRWTPCDAQQICFGPNEQTLIVAGEKSVRQIDFASLAILREHSIPAGLPLDIACSPNGSHVLVAGETAIQPTTGFRGIVPKGWLVAVDLSQDSVDTDLVGLVHRSDTSITCLAVSPDGESIAAANRASDSTDSAIWIWKWSRVIESNAWKDPIVINGHRLDVNDVAFHPDCEMLLSAADDGATLWDVREPIDRGKNVDQRKPLAYPSRVRWVEKANSYTGKVTPETGNAETTLFPALPIEQQTDASQVSPRADWPLVWIDERPRQDPLEGTSELSFWLRSAERQVQNERSVETNPSKSDFLNLYEMGPRSADWTRQLVFNFRERIHSLVDDDWRVLESYPKTDGEYQAALSPSGQRVAVCPRESSRRPFAEDFSIELWDADSGGKLWSNPTVAGTHVSGLELDRNDQYVMINDNGGRLIMLDASDGKELACYPSDGRQLLTVSSLAANGQTVAEAKKFRSQVTLLNPSTLDPIETIDTIFPVSWLRWTPDSKHLIVGQSFGEGMELVMCCDVANGEEIWTVRMPEAREVEFDQEGDWLLARCGGYQGVTTLCRVEDGTIAAVFLPTYIDGRRRLVLSKAGGTVYQGSETGGVVWPSP